MTAMAGKVWRVAIAGEGGQGVQVIGDTLAEVAYDEGKESSYLPNFGLEQRGGVSIAFVQIGEDEIGSPKFKVADVVVALSARAVRRMHMHVGPETVFVYDCSIADELEAGDLPTNVKRVLCIKALQASKEELDPRVFNMIVLGAILALTGVVTLEDIQKVLDKKLGYKFSQNPALRDLNFRALHRGMEMVEQAAQ